MNHPSGSWLLVLSAVAWLPTSSAAATVYRDDPLTQATFAGRASQGGAFSAAGWTTNAETDSVWYEITDALPSGRVEFTITGMALGVSLTGGDHDIFTMYQAPGAEPEPISYFPFRNNDFKAFIRINGSQDTNRPGAMKLDLSGCPQGDPWYHDSCPAGCNSYSGIAYAPSGTNWDVAVTYRMAVEWDLGTMKFFRDGAELGSVGYSGSYAPAPLRIRLGSPRNGVAYPGQDYMPIGITLRDVKITGTAGARTPTCGASTPPPPPPPPPLDAGTVDLGQPYAVLADVTAASWESGVFSDVNDLNVEGSGSAPTSAVYLRFPLIVGQVGRATLRLRTASTGSAGGGSGVVCAVSDTNWQETAMTWATRPAYGACLSTVETVPPNRDMDWDVTVLIAAGNAASFALVSTDADGAHFLSKESGGQTSGPRLFVELAAPPVDAGSPDAGAAPDGGLASQDGGNGGDGGAAPGVAILLLNLLWVRRLRRASSAPPRIPRRASPKPPGGGGGMFSVVAIRGLLYV